MDWMVDEIDFQQDKKDWDYKLKAGEKSLVSKLFRFFVQGDVLVADAYLDKYIPVIGRQPEIKSMMAVIAASETEHIVAYAKLLDTVGMPDEEFAAFKEHSEMTAKVDYLMQFDPAAFNEVLHNPESSPERILLAKQVLAKTLAVYSGFMEGLQLFSSFAVLMNFSRIDDATGKEAKLKGMGKVVEWSVRDELLHCEAMTWLFREFIKENPEIWTDEFKKEIYQAARDMVRLEDNFIDLIFKEAGEIEGMTKEELKKYIRFIADRRLADLGLKANWHVKENPFPWMEWMLMDSHTNFFEQRVSDYARGQDTEYF